MFTKRKSYFIIGNSLFWNELSKVKSVPVTDCGWLQTDCYKLIQKQHQFHCHDSSAKLHLSMKYQEKRRQGHVSVDKALARKAQGQDVYPHSINKMLSHFTRQVKAGELMPLQTGNTIASRLAQLSVSMSSRFDCETLLQRIRYKSNGGWLYKSILGYHMCAHPYVCPQKCKHAYTHMHTTHENGKRKI